MAPLADDGGAVGAGMASVTSGTGSARMMVGAAAGGGVSTGMARATGGSCTGRARRTGIGVCADAFVRQEQNCRRDDQRGDARPSLHFAVAKATFVTPARLQTLSTFTMFL